MFITIPGGQSLEQIITNQLGSLSSAVFQQVVQKNNLDYPYISQTPGTNSAPAQGTVQITNPTTTNVSVPSGTQVTAPAAIGGQTFVYTTIASTTVLAGGVQTVGVVSTVSGPFGNIGANTITTVVGFPQLNVTNPTPISGGYAYHVLSPGDQLWLPDPGNDVQAPTASVQDFQYFYQQGGTDFQITPAGAVQFSSNDILMSTNLQNMANDLLCRLRTPVGSLLWAPEAGSFISSLVGVNNTSTAIQKLIVAAKDSVLQDSRISNVQAQVVQLSPTYVLLEISATASNGQPLPTQQVSVNA